MNLKFSVRQTLASPADQSTPIQAFAKSSAKPKTPTPKGPKPPNWPSKNPGKPSGPGRGNNPPKKK